MRTVCFTSCFLFFPTSIESTASGGVSIIIEAPILFIDSTGSVVDTLFKQAVLQMGAESLITIKSSPANGIDVAAGLPWAIRAALPGPHVWGGSKSYDPPGRGASQHVVAAVIQPVRYPGGVRRILHSPGGMAAVECLEDWRSVGSKIAPGKRRPRNSRPGARTPQRAGE
jgi:hypothetical protein